MAQNTDLFDLIKSMNTTEKAYFKRYGYKQQSAEKDTKNNPYMRLFDAIDKQEVYDEDKLIKQFAKEKFLKNFSATKNYLFSMVMNSILDCNEGKNNIDQLLQMVREINLLAPRGLLQICLKKIEAAQKKATYLELWDIQCYLLHIKFVCLHGLYDEGKTDFGNVTEQAQQNLTLLQHTWEGLELLKVVKEKLQNKMSIGGRSQEQAEAWETLMQHPILQNKELALTTNTKLIHYYINIFYQIFHKNETQILSVVQEAIHFCEAQPLVLQELTEDYALFLDFEINILGLMHKWTALELAIEKFSKVLDKEEGKLTKEEVMAYRNNMLYFRLTTYYRTWNLEKCLNIIPQIKARTNITLPRQASDLFVIAKVYFMLSMFDEALATIDEALNIKESNHYADYYAALRILNLLVHIELGNEQLVEYTLRATYRFLKDRERLFEIERLFLRFLKKVLDSPNHKQTLELYNELHEAIAITVKANPQEQVALRILNLQFWLESKIKNIPMRELAKIYKARYEQEQQQITDT